MQVTERHLRYFKNEEFVREGRNWLPMYNPRLLILLDTFRHLTGPCILSPHKLALGRVDYPKNPTTLHKYDEQDGVRAVDCFPTLEPEHISASESGSMYEIANNWIDVAESISFSGIGLYTWWTLDGQVRPSLHLDIRKEPYQWGSIKVDGEIKEVTIDKALETL